MYRERLNGEGYFYPRLIERMHERGVKVKDLAKELGMDYYQTSRKINGIGQFKLNDIKKIVELLDCPFEELFKRGDNLSKS